VKEGKTPRTSATPTPKKNKWTDEVVAVAAAVEKNWRLTIQELASMLDLTFATILSALTIDLGLVKKSTRWVPKLLTTAQKDERDQWSEDFIQLLWQHSLASLNNLTMGESAVSFHTP
jgi:hypothetical protein